MAIIEQERSDSVHTLTEVVDDDVQTSVVLPAYNEAPNLRPLVDEIVATFDTPEGQLYAPYEIILVDDGSDDGTRDVMLDLAGEVDPVRGVALSRNFGQSAALAAGIDHALGDQVVTMDADRQNNPDDIPDLLSTLEEGYDCVSGWRRDREDSLSKTLPSAIQTKLARFTGADIHDYGCTLKAYESAALEDIDLYGEGHRYIPSLLYKRGYDITEQEVNHRPRGAGETKYGVTRLLRGFVDFLFHAFWNRYSTRPSHFLGGAGVLIMLTGLLIGAHAVFIKYAFGVALLPKTPRLILTVALVVFGFQMVMFGFLAEMIIKIHYKHEDIYRVDERYGYEEAE